MIDICVANSAVSSTSISVLKRLIFFPALYENKGIQTCSYCYSPNHCVLDYNLFHTGRSFQAHITCQALFQLLFRPVQRPSGEVTTSY